MSFNRVTKVDLIPSSKVIVPTTAGIVTIVANKDRSQVILVCLAPPHPLVGLSGPTSVIEVLSLPPLRWSKTLHKCVVTPDMAESIEMAQLSLSEAFNRTFFHVEEVLNSLRLKEPQDRPANLHRYWKIDLLDNVAGSLVSWCLDVRLDSLPPELLEPQGWNADALLAFATIVRCTDELVKDTSPTDEVPMAGEIEIEQALDVLCRFVSTLQMKAAVEYSTGPLEPLRRLAMQIMEKNENLENSGNPSGQVADTTEMRHQELSPQADPSKRVDTFSDDDAPESDPSGGRSTQTRSLFLDRPLGKKRLRILAIDGGGVRGLTSLMIIGHIMESLDPVHTPKPCEYFEIISGTSTGGLIAIMLGRLKMTVQDAIRAYCELFEFATKQAHEHSVHEFLIRSDTSGSIYDGDKFEEGLKNLLVDQGLSKDADFKDVESSACQCHVQTMTSSYKISLFSSSSQPHLHDASSFKDVKIWEAMRATIAVKPFFPPANIGRERYEDVDRLSLSPLLSLLDEETMRDLQDQVGCIVSVGAGPTGHHGNDERALGISTLLTEMSGLCESIAHDFCKTHPELDQQGRFYRFGTSSTDYTGGLDEWKHVEELSKLTLGYTLLEQTRAQLRCCLPRLRSQTRNEGGIRGLDFWKQFILYID